MPFWLHKRTRKHKPPRISAVRLSTYSWLWLFRSRRKFRLGGQTYKYATYYLNSSFCVERAVEIPIALETFPWEGNILEIGNVLSQYVPRPHDIVDKYEKGTGVVNTDIVGYNPGKLYDLIICISTLEHVGWDETPKEPEKILKAISTMKSLLTAEGRMLVTVPLRYNTFLDQCLIEGSLGFTRTLYMKRTSYLNAWIETTFEDACEYHYDEKHPCANGLAICFFEKKHAVTCSKTSVDF